MKSNLTSPAVIIAGIITTAACATTWLHVENTRKKTIVCNSQKLPQMLKLPIYSNAWQIIHSCDSQALEDTALALAVFEHEWRNTFGNMHHLDDAFDKLVIEWSSEKRYVSGYDIFGFPYEKRQVGGLLLSDGWVWVYTKPFLSICKTSLAHELVHALIKAEKVTDGDPDHEGTKYSGWTLQHTTFTQRVNKALCKIGL